MTARRLTPPRLAALQEQLSPRDDLILALLRRVRLATASQIQRLAFTDASPASNARMSRRALRRLTELRLVARLERPAGGVRAGSAGHVYALDVAGLRLTDPAERWPTTVRRPWTNLPQWHRHHLAVTELFAQLTEGHRAGHGELIDFVTEPAAWRSYTAPSGAPSVLRPDAFVRIGVDLTTEERWFVEMDLGTEGAAALGRKVRQHVDYWYSGEELRHHRMHPRTVFVVPDDRRLAFVVRVLARQPAETWQLFGVVRFDLAAQRLIGADVVTSRTADGRSPP